MSKGNGILRYLEEIGVKVPKEKLSVVQKELDDYAEKATDRFSRYLGYPNGLMGGFLPDKVINMLLLNIGGPQENGYKAPNTHDYEIEAIEFLKGVFHFPADRKEWGGGVTGSTEGVLSGVLNMRNLLKSKSSIEPVVIASSEAHYCAAKSAYITGLEFHPVVADSNGSMRLDELKHLLQRLGGRPIIVIATVETTVKGGYDNIDEISKLLDAHDAPGFIHVDAALAGLVAPFIDDVKDPYKPRFSPRVQSISVSLHKFLCSNRPSAMVLGLKPEGIKNPLAEQVAYINATDATVAGSRNGHSFMAFSCLTRLLGTEGLSKMANVCYGNAKYLAQSLRKGGVHVVHNPGALTVYFPRPSPEIVDKYTLACDGDGAHAITMQHVNKELIDDFVTDYLQWHEN
ncbi:MAG: pyridoxal-dependent decarboxylase [Pseudomonadota bacterium]